MVDTDSSCSIWPLRWFQTISLHAVNLSTDTYGQVSLTLDPGLHRSFRWIFIITNLPYPILGADFLDHFNLFIDVRRQKLVDNFTSLSAPSRSSTNALFNPNFFIASAGNQFHSLLLSYSDLVDPMFNSTKVVHSTVHHITTTGSPVFSHLRRLAPGRLMKVKAEFDNMLQLGLIRPSKSPWCDPTPRRPTPDYLSFLEPNYSWPVIHLVFFSHLRPGVLRISLRTHKTQPRGWRKRTNERTRTWVSSKRKKGEVYVTLLCSSPCICRLSRACILRETSTKPLGMLTHLLTALLLLLTASFC